MLIFLWDNKNDFKKNGKYLSSIHVYMTGYNKLHILSTHLDRNSHHFPQPFVCQIYKRKKRKKKNQHFGQVIQFQVKLLIECNGLQLEENQF